MDNLLNMVSDSRLLALMSGMSWIMGIIGGFLVINWALTKRDNLAISGEATSNFFKEQDVYASFGSIQITLNSIIVGAVFLIFLLLIMGNIAFALIGGIAGLTLPSLYDMYQADLRRKKFERDLPRTVEQLARRIRSGKSFEEALILAEEDAPPGTKSEMVRMAKELRLNAPLDETLSSAAKRINSDAFSSLVISLMVARRQGGDIQHTLVNLSGALREIIRLQEKLRTATMDGKQTVIAIAIIPFIVIFVVMMGQPELLESLTTRIEGIFMLLLAVVLYAAGLFFLQGILKTKI